jgi:hypothetical protein
MASPATLAPGSSPAVAEVAGRTVIVQASLYRANGHGGGPLPGDITKVYVLTTGTGLCRNDWPQFHRDARRTGVWRGGHDAWLPFDCPADFVRQQYRDFLGRTPDASGTSYWTSRIHQGTSGSAVIRSFVASNEFGRAVSPVVRSYLAVHGTYPPTAAIVRDAVAATRQGTSTAEVADDFAADPDVDQLTDEQFVQAVYRNVYQREPSYLELGAGTADLRSGLSRGELASFHAESSTGVSRLAPQVTVAMVYLGMLDRAPDAGGWTYWVGKARTGSTDALVTGFQRSSEYARRAG